MTTVESDSIYIQKDFLSKQNAMPLELFRMVLQYHPYHFWQLANADVPVTSACNDAVYEYSYLHADRIGRSEIREAISMAEKLITPHLGYSPYRHYVEEIVEFPYQNSAHVPAYFRIEGREGKVIAPGVETLSLILSNVTPTFSCEYNSNGVLDTFTIVLAPAENYDEDEIAIYVNETYHVRKFNNLGDYKIAPIIVNVDDTTNVITITGSIWLLVKPELYEGLGHENIDPSDTDNFVDSVDVYRNYTSSGASYDAAEAVLIWDDNPGLNRFCQTNGSITYAYGKLGVRDAHLGVFSIGEAVWDTDEEDWVTYNGWLSAIGTPDRAILRYRAGAEETTDFVKMISVLTAAELTRPICACDSANRWLAYWQADHSRVDNEADGVFRVTMRDMENPFGTRRGHIDAWKKIKAKMNFGGIAI
jgi:hypothetical protein